MDRLRPWIDLLVFLCTKDRRQILRHAFFHRKLPSVLSLRASRPNLVPRFSLRPGISGYTDSFQASSKVSIWGSHEKSHKSSIQEEIWVRGVLLSLVACFPGMGGGGYSIYPSVGKCGKAPHTLTLFRQISLIFQPCLRQNSDSWYPV